MTAVPSAAAPAAAKHHLQDFPDWLPAMLVKELRQGMRATMFVTPFIAVQFMAALAVAFEAQAGSAGRVDSPFWLVAFAVVGVIMPFRGFAALREESDGGNSALLMLGGLSRWQIVLGKWFVQMVLNSLTMLSLLPYLLVRYFFGGFEIIPNLLMVVNVLFSSAGVSACIIGASGYRPVPLRFIVAAIGSFWVLLSATFVYIGILGIESGWGVRLDFRTWVIGLCALGGQALYAVTGMQLGRAHLKLYLLPYEIAPTRSVVSLMIFLPFILLAGSIGTLFYGAPIVLAIIIWSMIRYDRPWKPKAGTRPQQISGMDTGWRPLN